jgi:hypothetical protein
MYNSRMIKFTYEKYAHPATASFKASSNAAPEHYAVPDQIIDAIAATIGIAEKSIEVALREIDDNPSISHRIGYPQNNFEMLQTVVATINRINPDFANIIQDAADEGRYVLEEMSTMGIPYMEELPAPPGKIGMLCRTEGSISSLRTAMAMAGRLIALDRSGLEKVPDDKVNRSHLLSLHIQGSFIECALFDPANKPSPQAYADADAILEKRTSSAFYMSQWMSALKVYHSGMAYAATLPPGDSDQADALQAAGVIHTRLSAPALFIARALYDVYSGKSPKGRKEMLETLYPEAGKYPKNFGLPPLNDLLIIAGAKDGQTLNQVFENAANSLFPISTIQPVRQTFGLWLPTAAEVDRYGR